MPRFPRLDSRPLAVLAVLTAVAAAVRFFRLGSPCLWGDEAEVYWRTCGTFAQLLGCLRTDGFSPLHYEMHWVIGRVLGVKPTPVALRLVPALCGTAMVPAIYFLARQLVDRPAALASAAVAACSGFLVFYSRDAKMYAEAWLMVTLMTGAMLRWFNRPTATAWLAWVAAGAAAVGVQMTCAVPVGLSLLLLLTHSKSHWRTGLAWIAGVAVVMAGPAGYFLSFNHWNARSGQDWNDSGIAWVDDYNAGRSVGPRGNPVTTGPDLAEFMATTFAVGWEIPKPADVTRVPPGQLRASRAAAVAVGAVLAAGLLPWPRRWTAAGDPPPRPRWVTLFWLGLWIGLPAYVYYAVSMPDFAVPFDWSAAVTRPFTGHPKVWSTVAVTLALSVASAGLIYLPTRASTARGLASVASAVAVLAVLQATGVGLRAAPKESWHSVWVPRYLGFVAPAVMVVMGTLLMRLPTAYFRAAAVAIVLAANLAVGGVRIFGRTEPPTDRLAQDYRAGQADPATLAWFVTPGSDNDKGPCAGNLATEPGRYYVQLLAWKQPMSPAQFRQSVTGRDVNSGPPDRGLPRAVARRPGVRKIIVWDVLPWPSPIPPDRSAAEMPGWQLTSAVEYDVREFWTGVGYCHYRRREYAR